MKRARNQRVAQPGSHAVGPDQSPVHDDVILGKEQANAAYSTVTDLARLRG